MKRILALCLILSLLLPAFALADLKRGSRGDEVKNAQEMLMEMGFLNDKADGIYGKKTESAVKSFQKFLGRKATGVLDDETSLSLMDVYFLATGVMADDGLGDDELQEIYPAFCSWKDADAASAEHCWRHQEMQLLEKYLQLPDAPPALEKMLNVRMAEICLGYMEALYDEWSEAASESEEDADTDVAEEQRELFLQALEEHRAGWAKEDTAKKPFFSIVAEAKWLAQQVVDLCFDLHGSESNGG